MSYGFSYPTWHLQGCLASYSTATAVTITAGSWRDNTDSWDVRSFPASTADLAVVGAGGLDQMVIAETGSSSSPTITASATVVGRFNSAALTGTYSSSTTTVTGSGTKFTTQVAVNDVIGNATNGYSRVTAIASDVSLTIVAAFPQGDAIAGSSGSVLYSPTIWIASTATDKRMVNTISAAGTAIVVDVVPGALSALGAGQTLTVGVAPNLASESTINYWMYLWLRYGSSGTTATWSTQRVTPFAVTGYTTALRRSGAVPIVGGNATPTLTHAYQRENSSFSRDCFFYDTLNTNNLRALNNGSVQGTWTKTACNNAAPPTSRQVWITMTGTVGGGSNTFGWVENGQQVVSGSGGTALPAGAFWLDIASISSVGYLAPVDATQAGMYLTDATSGAAVDVGGFREDLTR